MPRPGQVTIYSRRNPTSTPPPETILGSNLLDIFYASNASLSGSNVLSLTGQNGTVLTPTASNPQYFATDPNNYVTGPVIRFQASLSQTLRNNSLNTTPIFLPAGSRPFHWYLGYAHNFGEIHSMMVLADAETYTQHIRVYSGTYHASQFSVPTGTKLSGGLPASFGANLFGCHINASGVSVWMNGGFDARNNLAGFTTPTTMTTLTIGSSHGGGFADATFSVGGVCLAVPPAEELEQLWNWAQLRIRVGV